tara:strand:+ start:1138 stop:1770 length:633 start_codon:yes stop_codon:yes gene_type:complete
LSKNNIESIKRFFSTEENKTLLINQVNEEIGCFYELVLREISSIYNVKLKNFANVDYSNTSNDLFQDKKVLLFYITNSKQIDDLTKNDDQKIIISDYKNFKKYQKKLLVINGYQYEKDVNYFLNNIYNISDENLINYCISLPYFTISEAKKYKTNKSGYLTDIKDKVSNNFILEIRKEIFNLRKSKVDIKQLFFHIKNEAKYKKLNFLTY